MSGYVGAYMSDKYALVIGNVFLAASFCANTEGQIWICLAFAGAWMAIHVLEMSRK